MFVKDLNIKLSENIFDQIFLEFINVINEIKLNFSNLSQQLT